MNISEYQLPNIIQQFKCALIIFPKSNMIPIQSPDTAEQHFPETTIMQCVKVFKMMIRSSMFQQTILTVELLSTFLEEIRTEQSATQPLEQAGVILNILSYREAPMNQINFCKSILEKLKIRFLRGQEDIIKMHQKIRNFLLNPSFYELDEIQRWDAELFVTNIFEAQARCKEFIRLSLKSCLEVKDSSENWFKAVNQALMIINIPRYQNLSLIDTVYEAVFLTDIESRIAQNIVISEVIPESLIHETLKTICYLATSGKYTKFRTLLNNQSYLGNSDFWKRMLYFCGYPLTEIRVRAIVAITLLCNHITNFAYHFYAYGLSDLRVLINLFTEFNVGEGLYECLQFLSTWVTMLKKRLKELNQKDQKNISQSLIYFPVKVLLSDKLRDFQLSKSIQLLKSLIAGTEKVTQNMSDQIRKVLPLFSHKNPFLVGGLFQLAYDTIFENKNASKIFIGSIDLKARLAIELENQQSTLHFICLTLLLQISKGSYCNTYFLDQKIMLGLIRHGFFCSVSAAAIVIKLFRKMIELSIDIESKYCLILENSIMKSVLAAAYHSLQPNSALQQYYGLLDERIQDIHLIMQSIASLYTLTSPNTNEAKKFTRRKMQKVQQSFDAQTYDCLTVICESIFSFFSQETIVTVLRQETKIQKNQQEKIINVKMIMAFFSQLQYILRDTKIMKLVSKLKENCIKQICYRLDYSVIQQLSLPLILTIGIDYNGSLLTAFKIPKTTFAYFYQFVTYRISAFFPQQVTTIILKDATTGESITDDFQYKKMVKQAMKDMTIENEPMVKIEFQRCQAKAQNQDTNKLFLEQMIDERQKKQYEQNLKEQQERSNNQYLPDSRSMQSRSQVMQDLNYQYGVLQNQSIPVAVPVEPSYINQQRQFVYVPQPSSMHKSMYIPPNQNFISTPEKRTYPVSAKLASFNTTGNQNKKSPLWRSMGSLSKSLPRLNMCGTCGATLVNGACEDCRRPF